MTVAINYTQLQSLASDLITSLGTIYKLVRPTQKAGTVVDVVIASQIYGTFDNQITNYFGSTGGGIIVNQKKVIYIPVIKLGKVEPQPGDRLLYGNSQGWRVDSVDVIRPDNITTIMYTLAVS